MHGNGLPTRMQMCLRGRQETEKLFGVALLDKYAEGEALLPGLD